MQASVPPTDPARFSGEGIITKVCGRRTNCPRHAARGYSRRRSLLAQVDRIVNCSTEKHVAGVLLVTTFRLIFLPYLPSELTRRSRLDGARLSDVGVASLRRGLQREQGVGARIGRRRGGAADRHQPADQLRRRSRHSVGVAQGPAHKRVLLQVHSCVRAASLHPFPLQ